MPQGTDGPIHVPQASNLCMPKGTLGPMRMPKGTLGPMRMPKGTEGPIN